jgi:glutaredoxin
VFHSKARTSLSTTATRVTIYSKPGCHLCDRAKEVVERCRVEYEVIDITNDPALIQRYGNDIPVVLLDGQEIARHVLRERKLLELLERN